jgi:hypothetical protein
VYMRLTSLNLMKLMGWPMSYYYVNLIKQHFQFLIDEFGFAIIKESYDPGLNSVSGVVTYQSRSVNIEIEVDRAELLLKIGGRKSDRAKWFDFEDVMQIFAPEVEDVYRRSGAVQTLKDSVAASARIRYVALLLRQYCQPLLAGDFVMLPEIKDTENLRAKKDTGRSSTRPSSAPM